jgi:hypothetical protein
MPATEVAAKIKALLVADTYGVRQMLATVIDCG